MRGDASKKRWYRAGAGKGHVLGTLAGALAVLALVLGLLSLALAPRYGHVAAAPGRATATVPVRSDAAAASMNSTGTLIAQQVIAAFQAAGLPVNDLRQQLVGQGSPSGPPLTEREAWTFSIPGVAPSGGRIMIFVDDDKLHKKAAWFTRVGAGPHVLAHDNVILWLDPALPASDVARYRRALQGLG